MPTQLIQVLVVALQRSLTLSGTTIRTATISNATRTTVTDGLLEAEKVAAFAKALSSRANRKVKIEEVKDFIAQNPGEAALIFASIASTASDIYDAVIDFATMVRDAIFDPSNPDGESVFSSIEKQDGINVMTQLGHAFGVEPSVALVDTTYGNNDDLTQLPCRCATQTFVVHDRKKDVEIDAIITVEKTVPGVGCSLKSNLTTCEKVRNRIIEVDSHMDTCGAYEFLTRMTGSTTKAAQLIVAVQRITKGGAQ